METGQSGRPRRRWGIETRFGHGLWAALTILALVPGCCHVPLAERYFDRLDPMSTVNGFVYAVETGQWDFAYQCLTRESREAFSRAKMQLVILFGDVPETDLAIYDLLIEAERDRTLLRQDQDPEHPWLLLTYVDEEGETPILAVLRLYLSLEADGGRQGPEKDDGSARARGSLQYKIDLVRTVQSQGVSIDMPPA